MTVINENNSSFMVQPKMMAFLGYIETKKVDATGLQEAG